MINNLKDAVWVITSIAIPIGTYFIGKYKKIKDNNEVQNEALKLLLQNNLTNIYFVYDQMKEIPDYVYKNWLNMLKIYEKLDGDDYIHELQKRIEKFKIIKTDVLK